MTVAVRKLGAFKFSSYIAYSLPLGWAVYSGLWTTVLVVLVVVAIGFLYHWFDEKRFLAADAGAVCLMVVWNFRLCYRGHFQEPYFAIALILTAIAFYYYFFRQNSGSYSLNHGMWHMYGAPITFFCILTVTRL